MNQQELIELFAEAVELDSTQIRPESAISDYSEWNSLAWLTIIALLNERYDVTLSGKDIRRFKTVQDALDHIMAQPSA